MLKSRSEVVKWVELRSNGGNGGGDIDEDDDFRAFMVV